MLGRGFLSTRELEKPKTASRPFFGCRVRDIWLLPLSAGELEGVIELDPKIIFDPFLLPLGKWGKIKEVIPPILPSERGGNPE